MFGPRHVRGRAGNSGGSRLRGHAVRRNGAENAAALLAETFFPEGHALDRDLDDGLFAEAPVGSSKPNAFGLRGPTGVRRSGAASRTRATTATGAPATAPALGRKTSFASRAAAPISLRFRSPRPPFARSDRSTTPTWPRACASPATSTADEAPSRDHRADASVVGPSRPPGRRRGPSDATAKFARCTRVKGARPRR